MSLPERLDPNSNRYAERLDTIDIFLDELIDWHSIFVDGFSRKGQKRIRQNTSRDELLRISLRLRTAAERRQW